MVSIAILRTGPDVAEPIPVSMACELSSYGFFQRQVRTYIIATEFRGRLAFFCSRGILMENHGCVCVGTEGCGGRQVKIAGKHAASCFARPGFASMVSSARAGSALGFVVRRIFGFQFVHSPTFSDALCGRNEKAANSSNFECVRWGAEYQLCDRVRLEQKTRPDGSSYYVP